MKKLWLVIPLVLIVALALPALADPLTPLNPPLLAVQWITNTTITIRVTGGATYGAPNGFTVQWMVVPQGWSGLWPDTGLQQACFLGNGVLGSPFVLQPAGTVDVVVGTADARPVVAYAPPTASGALQPNTQYAFRAFANDLVAAYQRSAYTPTLLATTTNYPSPPVPPVAPEGDGEQQRSGKGYWKNHTSQWPAAINPNALFFSSGKTWAQVLKTPPKKGDTYYMLAHKYIAAKLNVLRGYAPSPQVLAALTQAEIYFATASPGVKANTPQGKINLRLAAVLASWGAAEDGQTAP